MLKSVRGRSMKTLYSSGPTLLQMMTTSRLTNRPEAPTRPNRNSKRQLFAWRTKMKCRSRSMIERAYRPNPSASAARSRFAVWTHGRAVLPVRVQPGRLAPRTSIGRAVHERLADDGSAATRAGAAFLAVNRKRAIEVSAGSVDVHIECVEGSTTLPERLAHDLGCRLQQFPGTSRRQGLSRSSVMHARPPQRFVGVDIADAGDQLLIQQGPLHPSSLPSQPSSDLGHAELRVERVAPDVRDLCRQVSTARREGQSAKHPLVDEAELRLAVGEAEPNARIRRIGCVAAFQPELTTHAQVREQRIAVDEGQPEILSSTSRLGEGPSGQCRLEIVLAWKVPADGACVQHLYLGDRASGDGGGETSSDGLDLGQFRHPPQRAAGLGLDIPFNAAKAIEAAFCSASFLFRPAPGP